MIVDKINQYLSEDEKGEGKDIAYEVGLLAQWGFTRQFMTDESADTKGKLRLSSAGKCPRQVGYAYHGFEKKGKEIDSRARLTFFAGDVVELTIVALAKAALNKYGGGMIMATGREQKTVKLALNGGFVEGHPDGLYLNLEDKVLRLIEVKSMSSFGYKRFEKGEVDESYIAQINVYLAALGLDECILLAYNKDANVLGELIIKKDEAVVEQCRENIKSVINSTPENLPEPKYSADDKGFYPWNCLYCAYWGHCHPNAEKVLVSKAYKLKEKEDVKKLAKAS